MKRHIACFALVVDDYDRAIAHYVDDLGFELREDSPRGGGKRWASFDACASRIAVSAPRGATSTQRARIGDQTGGCVGFFLHTDDFRRDHAAMLARGVRFVEAPRDEDYGIVAVFEDKYGNRWDLLESACLVEAP